MPARLRILAFTLIGLTCVAHAQPKKGGIPAPEDLKLLTSDGVNLHCSYLASTKGKEGVPVIILHDWRQTRSQYIALAKALQKAFGCAVIVPDLRGHGASDQRRTNNPGETEEIKIDRMNKGHMAQMYRDVDACKKHLMKENNAGKLNIERLCIIGNGFGSLLALNYAVYDWSAQQLPAYKMGRDVNGLILVAPVSSFKGYTAADAFKHPIVRSRLSVQILAPAGVPKGISEAKRLHKKLERFHPPLPDDMDERLKKQALFMLDVSMSPSGVGTADRRNGTAWKAIGQFVKLRLIDQPFEWQERKNPLID